MSQTIHMVQDPTDRTRWVVSSPYAAKDAIKDLPGRRWDPDRKVWTIPSYAVQQARRHLESCGFHVEVEENDTRIKALEGEAARLRRELQRADAEVADLRRELVKARQQSSVNPFNAIAAVLPESAHRNFYRRAIAAVHPDTGGSTRAAQMLNDSILGRAS